jgi:hypothetical protein
MIGSLLVWQNARNELDQVDATSDELTLLLADARALGQIHNVTSKGWISGVANVAHMREILKTLAELKNPPDVTFAVNSLEWLGMAARDLSVEKTTVRGITLQDEIRQDLQADTVRAYNAHEATVKQVSELIVNWNSHFGEERANNLKAASDAVDASVKTRDDIQNRLSQAILQDRQQQEELGAHKQALLDNAPALQLRSTLSIAAAILGAVLLAVVGLLLSRRRTSPTSASLPATQAQRHAEPTQRQRRRPKQH